MAAPNLLYMGLGIEATYGTLDTIDTYLDVTRFEMNTKPNVSGAETAGRGVRHSANLISSWCEGRAEGFVSPQSGIGYLLQALIAEPATSGTDPYTHVFTDPLDWKPDGLSFEMGLDEGAIPFSGGLVTGMEFSWSWDPGFITWSADLLAKAEESSDTLDAATFDSDALFHSNHMTVELDDADKTSVVTSWSVKIAKDVDPSGVIAGSSTAFAAQPGGDKLTVSGSIGLMEEESAFRAALDGATSKLEFLFDNTDEFNIEIPDARLVDPSMGIDGRKKQTPSYNFDAFYNGTKTLGLTLINSTATYT